MAKHGLKTLSYAYKQVPLDDLTDWMNEFHIESDNFRNKIEESLIYLGTFGLEDPIRESVHKAVQMIRYGTVFEDKVDRSRGAKNQVNIRMVTGDHMDTALYVAVKAGIISEEEASLDGICMTGEYFRGQIGEYKQVWDSQKQKYDIKFTDFDRFRAVKGRLRIIARATPEDKLLLVSGIRHAGGFVGMSGKAVGDSMALKEASVGICMGSGSQVAKDNSDLVILDNNFASINRSIVWGQAIFDNVRKFIQFQMTINLSLCSIVLICGATTGRSPLNVIQLLWTNLIMDVLGAIAIGTEPPTAKKNKSLEEMSTKVTRVSRKDKIIQPYMWRNILSQVAYQLVVVFFLNYFGTYIFYTETYNIISTPLRDENDEPTSLMVNDTIIFNTFILMNLFNMINCRVIDDQDLNVFKTLFNNGLFWLIMLFEIAIQYYMVFIAPFSKLGSVLMGTAELT